MGWGEQASEAPASAFAGIVAEIKAQANARADAAQKANDAAANSGGFKSSPLGAGVKEKFVRDAAEAKSEALVEAAVAEAPASV